MKTLITAVAAGLLTTALAANAGGHTQAANPADKISTNGAFETYEFGVRNSNNTDVRFGSGGALSIPGDTRANENSAVQQRSNNTDLVRPRGRN